MEQALIQVDETDWFGFNWAPAGANYYENVGGVLAHEIGHALGFDHVPFTAGASLMNINGGGFKLSPIDVAGAQSLYGMAQPTSVSGGISAITGCQNDTINLITPDDHFVFSGAGQDQIATGLGHDHITAGEGYDYVNSGGGNDTILGGGGFDQLNAGAGNDSISGGPDSDMIAGNEGNDTIDGGGGADWMSGGEGGDTFILRKGEVAGDTIAEFQTGVDHLVLIGYDNDPLINNGNGTWSIGGEMFIAGPINETTDVTRS
jgi:Ca2+-binding RTX toxin-like protein